MSDWAKALNEALLNRGDKIPSGWKTMAMIGKEWGKGYSGTQAALSLLIKSGRVEVKKFKVLYGKSVRVVPHYRLK